MTLVLTAGLRPSRRHPGTDCLLCLLQVACRTGWRLGKYLWVEDHEWCESVEGQHTLSPLQLETGISPSGHVSMEGEAGSKSHLLTLRAEDVWPKPMNCLHRGVCGSQTQTWCSGRSDQGAAFGEGGVPSTAALKFGTRAGRLEGNTGCVWCLVGLTVLRRVRRPHGGGGPEFPRRPQKEDRRCPQVTWRAVHGGTWKCGRTWVPRSPSWIPEVTRGCSGGDGRKNSGRD